MSTENKTLRERARALALALDEQGVPPSGRTMPVSPVEIQLHNLQSHPLCHIPWPPPPGTMLEGLELVPRMSPIRPRGHGQIANYPD